MGASLGSICSWVHSWKPHSGSCLQDRNTATAIDMAVGHSGTRHSKQTQTSTTTENHLWYSSYQRGPGLSSDSRPCRANLSCGAWGMYLMAVPKPHVRHKGSPTRQAGSRPSALASTSDPNLQELTLEIAAPALGSALKACPGLMAQQVSKACPATHSRSLA